MLQKLLSFITEKAMEMHVFFQIISIEITHTLHYCCYEVLEKKTQILSSLNKKKYSYYWKAKFCSSKNQNASSRIEAPPAPKISSLKFMKTLLVEYDEQKSVSIIQRHH